MILFLLGCVIPEPLPIADPRLAAERWCAADGALIRDCENSTCWVVTRAGLELELYCGTGTCKARPLKPRK